jgi:hypothetical protein
MSNQWPAEFDAFRLVHPAETLAELTLVTPQDLGRNYVLHISKNKELDLMVPYICVRAQKDEDRSVPRICTAPSIAACLVGYDTTIEEWMQGEETTDGFGQGSIPWCGGWYIYAIPFQYAFKPSEKLLKGVTATDEHWLVSYGPTTWSYKPIKVGKVFYTAVTHQAEGRFKTLMIDLCVEITHSDIKVPFCNGVKLGEGYYRMQSDRLLDMASFEDVALHGMQHLTKEEYDAVKIPTAALLSFASHAVLPEHVPSLHW